MKLGYDIRIEQSQKLAMTPELIQAIKLLALNTQELNSYVEEQLLTNPVLEAKEEKHSLDSEYLSESERHTTNGEDSAVDFSEQIERLIDNGKCDISYRQWESYNPDKEYSLENVAVYEVTLKDYLKGQLRYLSLTQIEHKIAIYMIEAIDRKGYLTVSVEDIASLFNVDEDVVNGVLTLIQNFDPKGIGARNLQECLKIQLEDLGLYDEKYEALISENMEAIADNKLSVVAKKLDITVKELQEMTDVIKSLEPKPGRQFLYSEKTKYIIPDLILEKTEDGYVVSLNETSTPSLNISSYYSSLFAKVKDGEDKELSEYLKKKVNSALWLIKSIEQRNNTIINVATAIVNHQKEFFDGGEKQLKPLTLKEVAAETDVHISTVSRCVNGKYLQGLGGIYELKFFFTRGFSDNSGGEASAHNVKQKIKSMIAAEDSKNPLSDQTIAEILCKEGTQISRRTIAKYRDEMNILSSAKRKRY